MVTHQDAGYFRSDGQAGARFLRNTPAMGSAVFLNTVSDFKVHYPGSKTRYSNPWYGYSAEPFGIVKMTCDGNGNTWGTVPTDSKTYTSGDTEAVPGSTGLLGRTGYTFSGWNTKPDGTGENYPAGGSIIIGEYNIILYAKWTLNTYNVTFNIQGGSIVPGRTAGYNALTPNIFITLSCYGLKRSKRPLSSLTLCLLSENTIAPSLFLWCHKDVQQSFGRFYIVLYS